MTRYFMKELVRKKSKFKTDLIRIKMTLNHSKILLQNEEISLLEYRKIIRELLKEVDQLNLNYFDNDIANFIRTLINDENYD